MIQSTTDELLRACDIKAGQIFRIRKALCKIPSCMKSGEDACPYVADTVTTGVILEATDISEMPVN